MSKIKVLLAGEAWMAGTIHTKGFDQFATSDYQTGIGPLKRALEGSDVELIHLPAPMVPSEFPSTLEALSAYDVLILSDIGANSLLLHPDTFIRGKRTPNRLKLIAEWVKGGGALLMAGGYYSFQGLNAGAQYRGTPIETVLPVEILPYDDRHEVPEGFSPVATAEHPILAGVEGEWPYLLGLNKVTAKPGATVLAAQTEEFGSHPVLVVGEYGKGRTMAWTSDIGPHWLPDEFSAWAGFPRLWRQAFAWLANKGA